MKREDLFLAIGGVEESRLLRSELAVCGSSGDKLLEEKDMKNRRKPGRILRSLLAAAVVISLLTVTAFAATGFLIFDSPAEMLAALFGDETGYDHQDVTTVTAPYDPDTAWELPGFERVPVDETVAAEDVVPHVSLVGQSISWQGYTLTVDAHLYDSVSHCGVVTYTLENPNGIKHYEVQPDGEVYFPGGEPVEINQFGNTYIIQERSSDTLLTAACYYQCIESVGTGLEIGLSHWAVVEDPQALMKLNEELIEQLRQEIPLEDAMERLRQNFGEDYEELAAGMTQGDLETAAYYQFLEEKFDSIYTCPDKITVDCSELDALDNVVLADGAVTVTPISIRVDAADLECLHTDVYGSAAADGGNVQTLTIRYTNGTEYTVLDDGTANYVFDLVTGWETEEHNVLTLIFNRIIDIEKVEAVVINGTELTVP